MAITARSNDTAGKAIDAAIVSLTAAIAAAGDVQSKAALTTALAVTQLTAVEHYLANGTIHAGNALASLSFTAANLPNNPKYGAQGSNISARITALTTAAATAGPSQNDARQSLLAAQAELFRELINTGATTPALVLSSLS